MPIILLRFSTGAVSPATGLSRLTLVEGDGLGVLAQTNERVAQVGLAQQLLGILPDERLAELDRRDCAERGI